MLCSVPETGGVGSVGCSTDRFLNTAYLSEVEEDEEPDTGVSMVGMLQHTNTHSGYTSFLFIYFKYISILDKTPQSCH